MQNYTFFYKQQLFLRIFFILVCRDAKKLHHRLIFPLNASEPSARLERQSPLPDTTVSTIDN